MRVLLLQLDGKMPNLALMRLSAHHKQQGDEVELRQCRRNVEPFLWDRFDKVYASTLFTKSLPLAKRLKEIYPQAVIGGTGWGFQTLESLGVTTGDKDYSLYPTETRSIGFTQRGCRLNCGFCVVPQKEGKVREEATIADLWRGDPWPRNILLLDNDFFGQPHWRDRIAEIRDGKFKVSFNQGINARMLSDEAAEAIASVRYSDDDFKRPRIYTAWDSIGDEGPLFRGLNALKRHGVKPDHVMVYMLIGNGDTPEDREHRRTELRAFGARPYPMPFTRSDELVGFQRWCVGAYDKRVPWEAWERANYRPERLP